MIRRGQESAIVPEKWTRRTRAKKTRWWLRHFWCWINSRFTLRRCVLNTRLHYFHMSGHLSHVILIAFTLPSCPRASSLCTIRRWCRWRCCFNDRSSWPTSRPLAWAPESTWLVNRTPCTFTRWPCVLNTKLHYSRVLGHLSQVVLIVFTLPGFPRLSSLCMIRGQGAAIVRIRRTKAKKITW